MLLLTSISILLSAVPHVNKYTYIYVYFYKVILYYVESWELLFSRQFQYIFAFICHTESPRLRLRLNLRLTESLSSCIWNRLDFVSVAIRWHVTYLSVKSNISNNVGLTHCTLLTDVHLFKAIHSHNTQHKNTYENIHYSLQSSEILCEIWTSILNAVVFWKCWVWCFILRFAAHISMRRIGFDSIKYWTSSHPIGNIKSHYLMIHWWSLAYRPGASS